MTAAIRPPLLRVEGLEIVTAAGLPIVEDIAFSLAPGQILGIVGESGSGKSTLANALLGHTRPGARISEGAVIVDGVDLLGLAPAGLRRARGAIVGHVAQDPALSLNPMQRIGAALDEMLRCHRPAFAASQRARHIAETLRSVALPEDAAFLRRYPHELSGGQQQRVQLALAFLPRPRLLVLDEPTTALDAITRAQILALVQAACRLHESAAIIVSHDLATLAGAVDRLLVLYAGRIAEIAETPALLALPRHPYARALLQASPDPQHRRELRAIPGHAPTVSERPAGCAFAPRCDRAETACETLRPALLPATAAERQVACHNPWTHTLAPPPPRGEAPPSAGAPLLRLRDLQASHQGRPVLHEVSLELYAGRCTALVGESGSGKTTLARALVGLHEEASGEIAYAGQPLPLAFRHRPEAARRAIQYIFQNPYRSLNPGKTVGASLAGVFHHVFPGQGIQARRYLVDALRQVGLGEAMLERRPVQLSGGERQRVAIARALLCRPAVLVCDEITAALDVSVQATLLDLLETLKQQGLAILFVSHDLGAVRAIADDILVINQGRLVEAGLAGDVIRAPRAAYTAELVRHAARLIS